MCIDNDTSASERGRVLAALVLLSAYALTTRWKQDGSEICLAGAAGHKSKRSKTGHRHFFFLSALGSEGDCRMINKTSGVAYNIHRTCVNLTVESPRVV